MSLAAGSRLGPHEIVSLIGVGGMGEVYLAHDTKLNRRVAIKVLPAAHAADAERIARFHREAQAVAALNHPGIAAIHDLAEASVAGGAQADVVRYLVLELVDGETLAERLAHGPLPVEEAIQFGRQIVDAVEFAHEKGICHRDLKPANIKITPGGVVKVLDFGLAKFMAGGAAGAAGAGAAAAVTHAPTLGVATTSPGVVLGTAGYMSPEQAKGFEADQRSDIFAFGCIFFEMLTGKRAFEGNSVSEVLASVLKSDVDFTALPARLNPRLIETLRRCLEKNPKKRWQAIGDVRLELETLTGFAVTVSPAASAPVARRSTWTLVAIVVIAAALGAGGAAAWFGAARSPDGGLVTRLDVVTPPTTEPFSFALSPDGRELVFAADGEEGSQLWLRRMDAAAAVPLAHTAGATYPFWSPDGRAVAFFADQKLQKLDLAGGAPEPLADANAGRGGTWNTAGTIVYAPAQNGPLFAIPAGGGDAVAVTTLDPGQGSHRWPHFLPDGRHFLFLAVLGTPESQGTFVGSIDGGRSARVTDHAFETTYAAPGRLMFVSGGTLLASRFDPVRMTSSGEPAAIATGVASDTALARSGFSVSDTGLVAERSGSATRRQLVWTNRAGQVIGRVSASEDSAMAYPQLSPDGTRVAIFRVVQGNGDIWMFDTVRGTTARLTSNAAQDSSPVWSPDGARIAFRSIRNGHWDLFDTSTTGDDERPLLISHEDKVPQDFSPDGHILLYGVQNAGTQSDLWALPLEGAQKPFPVVQGPYDEIQAQFSPDGRWIAYASNETGHYEVYVQPLRGAGGKLQVSVNGGIFPRWRKDGREIFYVTTSGDMKGVTVETDAKTDSLTLAAPTELSRTRMAITANNGYAGAGSKAQYAVAPDGRFLVNAIADDNKPSPITIVQNWAALAK